MRNRDEIVKNLLGDEGQEVTDYLDEIGLKKTFRTAETVFNAAGKKLESKVKESPIFKKAVEEEDEVVENWMNNLEEMNEHEYCISIYLQAMTVLYIIRLLKGSRNVPVPGEPLYEDDDMTELDDFFMEREREREKWSF